MPLTESVNQESIAISSNVGSAPSEQLSAEHTSTESLSAEQDTKVCWIEVKQYPYQPDHQVELLHLQAEADALLIKLQSRKQQKS